MVKGPQGLDRTETVTFWPTCLCQGGILWAKVGVRVIFLLQVWQITQTNFVLTRLHETISQFPLNLTIPPSLSFSLALIAILALSHTFSRLPFFFHRNPSRLSRAEAKCGCFSPLRCHIRQFVSVCVGSDLWPFIQLANGHRPSPLHAKTKGFHSY